jgi:glutaredoxin-like protein NrdH
MHVTVYIKPSCVQCDATHRALEKAGIECTSIDITADADARDHVMALGYLQAPVVITDTGDHWSRFRPDRLAELAA